MCEIIMFMEACFLHARKIYERIPSAHGEKDVIIYHRKLPHLLAINIKCFMIWKRSLVYDFHVYLFVIEACIHFISRKIYTCCGGGKS